MNASLGSSVVLIVLIDSTLIPWLNSTIGKKIKKRNSFFMIELWVLQYKDIENGLYTKSQPPAPIEKPFPKTHPTSGI